MMMRSTSISSRFYACIASMRHVSGLVLALPFTKISRRVSPWLTRTNVQAVDLASRFVRTGLHNTMMANYIYVICAFIDLEKGDERGDTLLVKLLVQPEPYM
jgi:hypothetical protein